MAKVIGGETKDAMEVRTRSTTTAARATTEAKATAVRVDTLRRAAAVAVAVVVMISITTPLLKASRSVRFSHLPAAAAVAAVTAVLRSRHISRAGLDIAVAVEVVAAPVAVAVGARQVASLIAAAVVEVTAVAVAGEAVVTEEIAKPVMGQAWATVIARGEYCFDAKGWRQRCGGHCVCLGDPSCFHTASPRCRALFRTQAGAHRCRYSVE